MPPERLGDPRYGDELVAMQLTGIGSAREGAMPWRKGSVLLCPNVPSNETSTFLQENREIISPLPMTYA